jgi:hypothetical protein
MAWRNCAAMVNRFIAPPTRRSRQTSSLGQGPAAIAPLPVMRGSQNDVGRAGPGHDTHCWTIP